MAENVPEFASLMHRVAQRDDRAIEQLYHRYNALLVSRLRRLLRRQPLLHTLFDAEWLANGIWADLLCIPARCQRFAAPHRFVAYLLGMARNQVHKAARGYLDTQKRDLRRRRHVSDPAVGAVAGAVADRQLTPLQQAECTDTWGQGLLFLIEREQRLVAV
jgi:hypothetical protein